MKKRTVAFIIVCIGIIIVLAIGLGLSEVEIAVANALMYVVGHVIADVMIIGATMLEGE